MSDAIDPTEWRSNAGGQRHRHATHDRPGEHIMSIAALAKSLMTSAMTARLRGDFVGSRAMRETGALALGSAR